MARCADCGSYLCRDHSVADGSGRVCSSGCRELERQHRRSLEAARYQSLVGQINSVLATFVPRMKAAGNPGADHLGLPETKRRSRLIGKGTTETVSPRGPRGWHVSSVGTGDDPDNDSSVKLASIGVDLTGRLVDLTHPAADPPAWVLGGETEVAGGPPRDYDDYDYRYLAEREVPRSLHELLLSHTGIGLPAEELRCYYCGHSGFHELTAMGSLWSLENWPRTCEDCVECWVGH